jgi:catechol 2,3-dioxygenase-like lactoylglutathione lyase family enzyme
MKLHGLDHVTLNSSNVERTCDFYSRLLGFEVQLMSGRGYNGAWLKLGDHPYIHVMPRAPERPETFGQVDHFAFQATGLEDMRRHLETAGVPFRDQALPEFELHQLVFQDPDGMKVELNFRVPAAEIATQGVSEPAR